MIFCFWPKRRTKRIHGSQSSAWQMQARKNSILAGHALVSLPTAIHSHLFWIADVEGDDV